MSSEPTVNVVYAKPGSGADAFQRGRRCGLSVDEAVAHLRQAVEAADLWVLHEIEPQKLLLRGGYAIGEARQILFFHARYVARMLAADPTALLEAPLKFAVLAMPEGGTLVRWYDPAFSFARYGNVALADLGHELAGICETITTTALGPS
jgi:uncharacterized protein (DUF302 family)